MLPGFHVLHFKVSDCPCHIKIQSNESILKNTTRRFNTTRIFLKF
jgi:hypothetical protein